MTTSSKVETRIAATTSAPRTIHAVLTHGPGYSVSDEQRLLDFVHAIVDSRHAQPLDATWLSAAVRTVVAGAGAGTLVRAAGKRAVAGRGRRA
jgi:hypothetical protein